MSKKKKKEQVFLSSAYSLDKRGNKESISGFAEAFEKIAESCAPFGGSSCYGYLTIPNAETGELMGLYVIGTEGAYTIVVEPYDEAVINTKALKEARS